MLAYNIINDLEILCTNRGEVSISNIKGCEWKGRMEDITNHMPQCLFADGNIPGWYATYMKSKEKEYEEQELKEDLLVISLSIKPLGRWT